MTEALQLVQQVVERWRGQQIARPGVPVVELRAIERRLGAPLPEEVEMLYRAADGMESGDFDQHLIRFWPISEWIRAGDSTITAQDGGLWVFADYSLWAHGYAVRLTGATDALGEVLMVADPRVRIPVAKSFRDFLSYYLEDPTRLFHC